MTGPATFTARDERVYDGPEDELHVAANAELARQRAAVLAQNDEDAANTRYIPLQAHPSFCECSECYPEPEFTDEEWNTMYPQETTMNLTHDGLTYICMTCGEDAPTVARICTKCLFKAQQYAAAANDAIVTADDIRQDASFYAAEACAEAHASDCECEECIIRSDEGYEQAWEDYQQGQRDVQKLSEIVSTMRAFFPEDADNGDALEHAEAYADGHDYDPECSCDACCEDPAFRAAVDTALRSQGAQPPAWNARLAARAASIVTAAGGLALAIACLTGTPSSAREYPIIGTPAYDASCSIVRKWEDGGALAYCTEDGETLVFDADGGFIYDNGIKYFYRAEGTWYVAPERLQIGPNAPADAR